MMGRGNNTENNNSNILYSSSSIALLQERFRQLQKVKEMREERELRRASTVAVAAAAAAAAAGGERQPGWFFHPDLVRPSRPSDGPMYRGLSSTDDDRAEFSALETSLSVGFRPNKPAHAVSSHELRNCTGKDVDTSLHL